LEGTSHRCEGDRGDRSDHGDRGDHGDRDLSQLGTQQRLNFSLTIDSALAASARRLQKAHRCQPPSRPWEEIRMLDV
jgi:hypothetical protein